MVRQYKADYVLSSMRVKDLILCMNDVTTEVIRVASGLKYRSSIIVGV